MTTDPATLSWPNHLLTLADWEALPEDSVLRLELVEGVLMMSPQPFSWHQRAVTGLTYRLDAQLPATLIALAEVEVVLGKDPLTIRVPDLVVTRTAVYEGNPRRYPASEVSLAVEVLSEGTRRVDRVLKLAEYADAGIPQYWIVDLDPPTTLTAHLLVDGAYEVVAECGGVVDLDVAGHAAGLDLGSLTRR